MRFLSTARARVTESTGAILTQLAKESVIDSSKISNVIWNSLAKEWDGTTTLDLTQRAQKTAEVAAAHLMRELQQSVSLDCSVSELFRAIDTWTSTLAETIRSVYGAEREEMFSRHREITPK